MAGWGVGRGGDVVIDCAGVPSALAEGLEMAARGGTYLETGAYVETGTAEISPHRHLCSKSIRLIGSTNRPFTGYGPALRLLEFYGEQAGSGSSSRTASRWPESNRRSRPRSLPTPAGCSSPASGASVADHSLRAHTPASIPPST
jgi:hypothetical protein